MEKFWTLHRMNKNGNGKPVWAGKNGGARYLTAELAAARAGELAHEHQQDVFIQQCMAVAHNTIKFVPAPPLMIPISVVEITAI